MISRKAKRLKLAMLMLFLNSFVIAQFPPAAGQEGSTAVNKDSSVFIGWAEMCTVERGYMDISIPDSGFVNYGEVENTLGQADNFVLSLGDGGVATMGFNVPVYNGEGFDFCVFENALNDTFLELAFVEVSSDGESFFRFPATSLTQTLTQTETYGPTMPEEINNLAGKYKLFYGTPFDLNEMKDILDLNVDSITQIRIIDVVGSIDDDFATYDSHGNKINDPWPTLFPTGGFDLDAVGVIHNLLNHDINENVTSDYQVFPNPVIDYLTIECISEYGIELFSIEGNLLFQTNSRNTQIKMDYYPPGIYILKIFNNKKKYIRKIVKQ